LPSTCAINGTGPFTSEGVRSLVGSAFAAVSAFGGSFAAGSIGFDGCFWFGGDSDDTEAILSPLTFLPLFRLFPFFGGI
jgi:hypothetical protein